MKASVAEFLGVAEDDVHADYFGLNHAGWIHRVLVDGRDRLPEILDRYEELQRTEDSWRLFDPDLVRALGMLPMEYLYFYYYRRQAVEHVLVRRHAGREIAASTRRCGGCAADRRRDPRARDAWASDGRCDATYSPASAGGARRAGCGCPPSPSGAW
jgi:6-phospho-beta-glucosidase